MCFARCVAKCKRFPRVFSSVKEVPPAESVPDSGLKFLLKVVGSPVSVIQLNNKGINIETNTLIRVLFSINTRKHYILLGGVAQNMRNSHVSGDWLRLMLVALPGLFCLPYL